MREELSEDNSVVAKFAATASDGKTYMMEHYNLDAYDHQNVARPKGSKATYVLTYKEWRDRLHTLLTTKPLTGYLYDLIVNVSIP